MPDFSPHHGKLTPDYYGKGPHKETARGLEQNGPFAYVGSERDEAGNARGYSIGAGLMHGSMGGDARGDVLSAQGHFGNWRDEQGRSNWGIAGDAGLVRVGMGPGGGLGPFGFDVGVLTANAGIQANEETSSVGAGANLIEGSVSLANKEHGLRIGGSVGVGLGGRTHYGDADGDGVREYGIGFDAGPLSVDLKSEYLGHAANAIGSAWDTVSSW